MFTNGTALTEGCNVYGYMHVTYKPHQASLPPVFKCMRVHKYVCLFIGMCIL